MSILSVSFYQFICFQGKRNDFTSISTVTLPIHHFFSTVVNRVVPNASHVCVIDQIGRLPLRMRLNSHDSIVSPTTKGIKNID